jgi:hypothetical protein
MSPLVLDDDLRSRPNGLNEPVPVCEADGRTVGHFLLEDLYLKWLYSRAVETVSTADLDAAAAEPGGQTLAEVKARLGIS